MHSYNSSFCCLAFLFPLPLFRGSGSGNNSSSANRKSKNFQYFTSLEEILRVYITCVIILELEISRKCEKIENLMFALLLLLPLPLPLNSGSGNNSGDARMS